MRPTALLAAIALALCSTTSRAEEPAWDVMADTWVATDGLGRAVPGGGEVGPPKADKTVGVFYFLWSEGQNPIYDLSKILATTATTTRTSSASTSRCSPTRAWTSGSSTSPTP